MSKFAKKIYIAIAAVILVVPMLLMPFFVQKNQADILEMDKRYPTTLSDVLNTAEKTVTFEKWFNDHLAFRKPVISAWSQLNFALNVSSNPYYITVGKQGWLFLGNVHAGKLDQYRRIAAYTNKSVNADIANVQALNDYLAANDMAFLFIMPPNKESIYPEHMPLWATIGMGNKYIEVFNANGGQALVLDLTETVAAQKLTYGTRLYPKTDAHWSTLGAYFGYKATVNALGQKIGTDFETVTLNGYTLAPYSGYELTKALGYAGRYDDFKTEMDVAPNAEIEKEFLSDVDNWQGLAQLSNPDALNDAAVLIIGDSFNSAMLPYFANTFTTVYWVHFAQAFNAQSTPDDLYTVLDLVDANMVVLEIIERHLPSSLPLLPNSY